jgi:hypothetical protein
MSMATETSICGSTTRARATPSGSTSTTARATSADETSQRVSGNPGADDNGVACIDADGDGDFDAAVMSLSGNERILWNDGTGHFTHNANDPGFPSVGDGTLWFDFGDVNGDGRLDCVTAQGESSSLDRLYVGIAPAPIDGKPPAFRGVEALASSVTRAPRPSSISRSPTAW